MEKLQRYDLNCNIFDVYNYDGLSMQELLCQFYTKINECVDFSNSTLDLCSWLVNEGLKEEVAEKLTKWLNDGTLENLINTTLFENLNKKIDGIIENNRVNVKDYGAIGDWNSHPAYETYNSLEELQKVYPNATSLSDEIDTLAIEKAINNNYKEIYIPYGGYKINKTLKLQQNQKLYGGGKHITQLDCDEELEKVILLEGSNITISELKLTTKFTSGAIGSPNTKTSCIWGNRKNHLTFDNLFIVGFNEAISLNENAYVTYMNRLRIQSCNMGIKAHGEFNNVSILQTSITYCNQCMDLGGGSNILIQGCDIERSNRGIVKKSIGDVNIRDSYFELNEESSIEINWQTDFALIDGNSFFSHGSGQKDIIKYHTSPDKKIIISNNNYRSYEITGDKLKCLTPTNGTLVKPIFVNNVMTEDYVLGVSQNAINTETYYDNGLRVGFVSDINNGLTTDIPSVRGVFTDRGVINLPQLRDLNKVFKIVFVKSGESLESEFMTLNSNTHNIVGHNRINPNQIYSIYFNRVVGDKEEIILCKG